MTALFIKKCPSLCSVNVVRSTFFASAKESRGLIRALKNILSHLHNKKPHYPVLTQSIELYTFTFILPYLKTTFFDSTMSERSKSYFLTEKPFSMKKLHSLLSNENVQSTLVILSIFLITGLVILVSKH